MTTLSEIKSFLEPKRLAIAGASRNPKKFGGMIFSALQKRGFELFPVHPQAETLGGLACWPSVSQLPDGIDRLYVVTPKNKTFAIVEEAISKGIGKIWIQQQSETPEALELAARNNVEVISGKCLFMFAEPVESIHGFHRWVSKLFGAYPQN